MGTRDTVIGANEKFENREPACHNIHDIVQLSCAVKSTFKMLL